MMNRKYHRDYSRAYYHRRKQKLIDMLGGKCAKCGTTDELTFDHKDPTEKSFSVGKLLNYRWSIILREIEKCQILCAPCHREKNRSDGTFKLNAEQVLAIRKLLRAGVSQQEIARQFVIHQTTVSDLKRMRTWKHLGDMAESG